MNRYDIHASIKKKGHTLSSIADELGVTRSVVSAVVADRSTVSRVAARISEIVGMEPYVLWPRRYQPSTWSPKREQRT